MVVFRGDQIGLSGRRGKCPVIAHTVPIRCYSLRAEVRNRLVGMQQASSANPLCVKRRRGGLLCFADVFLHFIGFRQTHYLNIYRTDLHEICRIGRTLAVDERCYVYY